MKDILETVQVSSNMDEKEAAAKELETFIHKFQNDQDFYKRGEQLCKQIRRLKEKKNAAPPSDYSSKIK